MVSKDIAVIDLAVINLSALILADTEFMSLQVAGHAPQSPGPAAGNVEIVWQPTMHSPPADIIYQEVITPTQARQLAQRILSCADFAEGIDGEGHEY